MNDQVDRRLAAALRAQASGSAAGAAARGRRAPPIQPSHEPRQARRGLPGWAVLAVAVGLGTTAGALAGVISAW